MFPKKKGEESRFPVEHEELVTLLTDEEYKAARLNSVNAHYTDLAIVQAMWDGLSRFGFRGGRVFEPGCGSGNFIALAPLGTAMVGVELDPITAKITAALYPHSQIRSENFRDTRLPEGSFDAAIGNVPFGKIHLTDPVYNPRQRDPIHTYFIRKSAALVRPGGLIALITSRYTMDGTSADAVEARREIAGLGELLAAVRLPESAHQRTAGTRVVTDVLFLRRFEEGEQAPASDPAWIETVPVQVGEHEMHINRYWTDHANMVLGEFDIGGARRKDDLRVIAPEGTSIADGLADAVGAAAAQRAMATAPRPVISAPDERRIEGYQQAHPDGTFTRITDGFEVPFDPPGGPAGAAELRALLGIRDTVLDLLDAEYTTADDAGLVDDLRAQLNSRYDKYVADYGPVGRYTPLVKIHPSAEGQQLRAQLLDAGLAHYSGGSADVADAALQDRLVENGHATRDEDGTFTWRRTRAARAERERLIGTGQAVRRGGSFQLTDDGRAWVLEHLADLHDVVTVGKIRPQQGGFRDDPFCERVRSLETYDPETGTTGKRDVMQHRVLLPRPPVDRADSPEDALAVCMDRYAEVRLDVIASLLGAASEKDARARLGTLVFDDPAEGRLVTRAEYLSGNVRKKYREAEAAAASDPDFQVNADALKDVIPRDLGPDEIEARLGAVFVTGEHAQQFLRETLDDPSVTVSRDRNGTWEVSGNRSKSNATIRWGTAKRDALFLAENLLNRGKPVKVTWTDREGKTHIDEEATEAAREKQAELADRFAGWAWENLDRSQEICRRFNDRFSSEVLRSYDDVHLSLPGVNRDITLNWWQESAIARMIYEPSAGLYHDMGAGKTLEMIIGLMEQRRLGLIKKPVIVVKNSLLEQFRDEFMWAYPRARLLCADTSDLAGDGRRAFIARCAAETPDCIIMTRGAYESIPLTAEGHEAYISHIKDIFEGHAEAVTDSVKDQATMLAEFEERLRAYFDPEYQDDGEDEDDERDAKPRKRKRKIEQDPSMCWEHLGIDYIGVDEAQDYNNLWTPSEEPGLAIDFVHRSVDHEAKLLATRRKYGNRATTETTGTPVTNKITQFHVLQRRVRPERLAELGFDSFASWAATFTEMEQRLEMKPDGTFGMVDRMRLINVPQLLRELHYFGDFKSADDIGLERPAIRGGRIEIKGVPATQALKDYQKTLPGRYALAKTGKKRKGDDIVPTVMGDGFTAAQGIQPQGRHSARLEVTDEPRKIHYVADDVFAEWEAHRDNEYLGDDGQPSPVKGGLQLVFCSVGVPTKRGAPSLYDELRDLLVAKGMPRNMIRFIHDAADSRKKKELFAACRAGHVAVLIGSTEKMGVGVNVQNRCIGVHHVHPHWRPDYDEQEDARARRPHNQNAEVFIKKWITEESFDTIRAQACERKAVFLRAVKHPDPSLRSIDVPDDDADLYAHVAAIGAGEPRLREKAQLESQRQQLLRKQRRHVNSQRALAGARQQALAAIQAAEKTITDIDDAAARVVPVAGDAFRMDIDGTEHESRTKAGEHLRKYLLEARASIPVGSRRSVTVGTLGGLQLQADLYRDSRTEDTVLTLGGVRGTAISLDHTDLPPARGLVTRLENKLNRLGNLRQEAQERLEENRKEVSRAESGIGVPFPQEQELLDTQKALDKLVAELRRGKGGTNNDKAEEDTPDTGNPQQATAGAQDPRTAALEEILVMFEDRTVFPDAERFADFYLRKYGHGDPGTWPLAMQVYNDEWLPDQPADHPLKQRATPAAPEEAAPGTSPSPEETARPASETGRAPETPADVRPAAESSAPPVQTTPEAEDPGTVPVPAAKPETAPALDSTAPSQGSASPASLAAAPGDPGESWVAAHRHAGPITALIEAAAADRQVATWASANTPDRFYLVFPGWADDFVAAMITDDNQVPVFAAEFFNGGNPSLRAAVISEAASRAYQAHSMTQAPDGLFMDLAARDAAGTIEADSRKPPCGCPPGKSTSGNRRDAGAAILTGMHLARAGTPPDRCGITWDTAAAGWTVCLHGDTGAPYRMLVPPDAGSWQLKTPGGGTTTIDGASPAAAADALLAETGQHDAPAVMIPEPDSGPDLVPGDDPGAAAAAGLLAAAPLGGYADDAELAKGLNTVYAAWKNTQSAAWYKDQGALSAAATAAFGAERRQDAAGLFGDLAVEASLRARSPDAAGEDGYRLHLAASNLARAAAAHMARLEAGTASADDDQVAAPRVLAPGSGPLGLDPPGYGDRVEYQAGRAAAFKAQARCRDSEFGTVLPWVKPDDSDVLRDSDAWARLARAVIATLDEGTPDPSGTLHGLAAAAGLHDARLHAEVNAARRTSLPYTHASDYRDGTAEVARAALAWTRTRTHAVTRDPHDAPSRVLGVTTARLADDNASRSVRALTTGLPAQTTASDMETLMERRAEDTAAACAQLRAALHPSAWQNPEDRDVLGRLITAAAAHAAAVRAARLAGTIGGLAEDLTDRDEGARRFAELAELGARHGMTAHGARASEIEIWLKSRHGHGTALRQLRPGGPLLTDAGRPVPDPDGYLSAVADAAFAVGRDAVHGETADRLYAESAGYPADTSGERSFGHYHWNDALTTARNRAAADNISYYVCGHGRALVVTSRRPEGPCYIAEPGRRWSAGNGAWPLADGKEPLRIHLTALLTEPAPPASLRRAVTAVQEPPAATTDAENDSGIVLLRHGEFDSAFTRVGKTDTDLHRVLKGAGFKFTKGTWWLPRRTSKDDRDWKVGKVKAWLKEAGRPFAEVDSPLPHKAADAPAPQDSVPYPDLHAVTGGYRRILRAYAKVDTGRDAPKHWDASRSDARVLMDATGALSHFDRHGPPGDVAGNLDATVRYVAGLTAEVSAAAWALRENLAEQKISTAKWTPLFEFLADTAEREAGHMAATVTSGTLVPVPGESTGPQPDTPDQDEEASQEHDQQAPAAAASLPPAGDDNDLGEEHYHALARQLATMPSGQVPDAVAGLSRTVAGEVRDVLGFHFPEHEHGIDFGPGAQYAFDVCTWYLNDDGTPPPQPASTNSDSPAPDQPDGPVAGMSVPPATVTAAPPAAEHPATAPLGTSDPDRVGATPPVSAAGAGAEPEPALGGEPDSAPETVQWTLISGLPGGAWYEFAVINGHRMTVEPVRGNPSLYRVLLDRQKIGSSTDSYEGKLTARKMAEDHARSLPPGPKASGPAPGEDTGTDLSLQEVAAAYQAVHGTDLPAPVQQQWPRRQPGSAADALRSESWYLAALNVREDGRPMSAVPLYLAAGEMQAESDRLSQEPGPEESREDRITVADALSDAARSVRNDDLDEAGSFIHQARGISPVSPLHELLNQEQARIDGLRAAETAAGKNPLDGLPHVPTGQNQLPEESEGLSSTGHRDIVQNASGTESVDGPPEQAPPAAEGTAVKARTTTTDPLALVQWTSMTGYTNATDDSPVPQVTVVTRNQVTQLRGGETCREETWVHQAREGTLSEGQTCVMRRTSVPGSDPVQWTRTRPSKYFPLVILCTDGVDHDGHGTQGVGYHAIDSSGPDPAQDAMIRATGAYDQLPTEQKEQYDHLVEVALGSRWRRDQAGEWDETVRHLSRRLAEGDLPAPDNIRNGSPTFRTAWQFVRHYHAAGIEPPPAYTSPVPGPGKPGTPAGVSEKPKPTTVPPAHQSRRRPGRADAETPTASADGAKGAVTFMNADDVDHAVELWHDRTALGGVALTLASIKGFTYAAGTDGWGVWKLPDHRSRDLIGLVDYPRRSLEAQPAVLRALFDHGNENTVPLPSHKQLKAAFRGPRRLRTESRKQGFRADFVLYGPNGPETGEKGALTGTDLARGLHGLSLAEIQALADGEIPDIAWRRHDSAAARDRADGCHRAVEYTTAHGITITVTSTDASQPGRGGLIAWEQASQWLRPVLTPLLRTLLSEASQAELDQPRDGTHAEARDRDGLAETVKEQITGAALALHGTSGPITFAQPDDPADLFSLPPEPSPGRDIGDSEVLLLLGRIRALTGTADPASDQAALETPGTAADAGPGDAAPEGQEPSSHAYPLAVLEELTPREAAALLLKPGQADADQQHRAAAESMQAGMTPGMRAILDEGSSLVDLAARAAAAHRGQQYGPVFEAYEKEMNSFLSRGLRIVASNAAGAAAERRPRRPAHPRTDPRARARSQRAGSGTGRSR